VLCPCQAHAEFTLHARYLVVQPSAGAGAAAAAQAVAGAGAMAGGVGSVWPLVRPRVRAGRGRPRAGAYTRSLFSST